jgi:succinyl-CoA synthetase beta subunit
VNLHEFQAKEVFRKYGIPVSTGHVAETPEQAADAFGKLGGPVAVVKSQIHAGGRGKGTVYEKDLKTVRLQGGVKLVKSAVEAKDIAAKILGFPLVTKQSGPQGRVVRRVYVEAGCDIDRELYFGAVLDRKAGKPVLMASTQGGMEIEEVAHKDPNAIVKEHWDIGYGLQGYQARRVAYALGLSGESFKQFTKMVMAVTRMFAEKDCSLLEINPLVVTKKGDVLALDGKMGIDDRAIELKKQAELEAMRDVGEEDPVEYEAASYGLNYVSMEGNIGCMVNGAGLAMATMDIIKQAGGAPANFLDVGGGANKDQVKKAFKLLLSNPDVKALFINIFGGILRCDVLAAGVIAAVTELGVPVPIVIRMKGTNVEEGKKMLADSGLNFATADTMGEAADKVVALARKEAGR